MPNLPDPFTREQLLNAFTTEWDALMTVIDEADADALMTKTDASGWNARDHLGNLVAWLNSVIVMVRDGEEQWTGLGAPQKLFSFADYDPLNEAIRQNMIGWPLEKVLTQLRERHETMMGIVSGMSDEDLLKPMSSFVPGSGEFAVCYKIDGNGPHHYREHREWISEILNQEAET